MTFLGTNRKRGFTRFVLGKKASRKSNRSESLCSSRPCKHRSVTQRVWSGRVRRLVLDAETRGFEVNCVKTKCFVAKPCFPPPSGFPSAGHPGTNFTFKKMKNAALAAAVAMAVLPEASAFAPSAGLPLRGNQLLSAKVGAHPPAPLALGVSCALYPEHTIRVPRSCMCCLGYCPHTGFIFMCVLFAGTLCTQTRDCAHNVRAEQPAQGIPRQAHTDGQGRGLCGCARNGCCPASHSTGWW